MKVNDEDILTADVVSTLTNKTLTAPKFADGGFIAVPASDITIFDENLTTPVPFAPKLRSTSVSPPC